MDKLSLTIQRVESALARYKSPVIYFSGGKDSIVMTYIIAILMGRKLPCIFHREPFMVEKYTFGMDVLAGWQLTAYDYPPIAVSLWEGKGIMAFTNHYQIGRLPDGKPAVLDLPKNIIEPDPKAFPEKPFLCGVNAILDRPCGSFNYPWDCAFVGHKDCDSDQIAGDTHLYTDFVQNIGGPNLAFPLRHWSHDEVWDFIESEGLPVQEDRYDAASRTERKDKSKNSDYFPVCIACIDRRRTEKFVPCPMMGGATISSIADQVPYRDLTLPYFGNSATPPP